MSNRSSKKPISSSDEEWSPSSNEESEDSEYLPSSSSNGESKDYSSETTEEESEEDLIKLRRGKRKKHNNNTHSTSDKRRKRFTSGEETVSSESNETSPKDIITNIKFFFDTADESRSPDKYHSYLDTLKRKDKQVLIQKEKDLYNKKENIIPLKYKIINSTLSDKNKIYILDKIKQFDSLSNFSSEFFKLKKYLDIVEQIPFGIYNKLAIERTSNTSEINDFLNNIKSGLDDFIFGQDKAKNSLIEIIAKWITNPGTNGNIIGLCGPPGVGKTSLIKNGLAKTINLPFSFISLGGLSDSANLTGFDYTYEGAKCGRIIEILIENKCMNPIIFFDELDKISETRHGEEIVSVLIHLTDPTQNNSFLDKYFSGIEFDLSKAFIIFSFNDANKINPILKDRITVVNCDSFSQEDKVKIAKDYSIPKLCKNIGMNMNNFNISDATINKIVSNYCSEKGVRKLEQCLDKIIMKINLYELTNNSKYLFLEKDVEKPYEIDAELVAKILDPIYNNNQADISLKMMYT